MALSTSLRTGATSLAEFATSTRPEQVNISPVPRMTSNLAQGAALIAVVLPVSTQPSSQWHLGPWLPPLLSPI